MSVLLHSQTVSPRALRSRRPTPHRIHNMNKGFENAIEKNVGRKQAGSVLYDDDVFSVYISF